MTFNNIIAREKMKIDKIIAGYAEMAWFRCFIPP
jgi:hypothetical protein